MIAEERMMLAAIATLAFGAGAPAARSPIRRA